MRRGLHLRRQRRERRWIKGRACLLKTADGNVLVLAQELMNEWAQRFVRWEFKIVEGPCAD